MSDKIAAELQQSIRGGPMANPMKRHEVTQPLDQSYRLIALTQGQTAIVDAADFNWLSHWNWFAMWSPNTKSFYAMRNIRRFGRRNCIGMHQVILDCVEGVDHKNHDTLDNRRTNIRRCTQSQNGSHMRTHRDNRSGFKGVTASGRKWVASIISKRKSKYLGSFDSAEEAAHAYDKAAKIYHGEFAFLNFP